MTHRHLDALHDRLQRAAAPDVIPLINAIAEHKARMAELPQVLTEEVRDEIVMWERQIPVQEGRTDRMRDRDIAEIRAKIAALMAPADAEQVAA